MKLLTRYHHSKITISIIVLSIVLLTKCISHNENNGVADRNAYNRFAGSTACANCHKNIYASHLHTAHYLTTKPASDTFIKGSFEKGNNAFAFNDSVAVFMEKRSNGFYQVEYDNGIERRARRMDIVVGSGTMGQSFLHWRNRSLFQLPITFFSAANQWSNSPGFPEKPVFNRIITSRCLECHTTFAGRLSAPDVEMEQFDSSQIIFGVDCEKCHGPAAQHVQFQLQHPHDTFGRFILNPATFSRRQKLDLCALCHGGRLQKTKPSFTFQAGDTLSNYFVVDTTAPDPNNIDVHGNQYGLLRASKCFKMSATLTCNTCHNTHENEKGQLALFSQRCMTCHNPEHGTFCKMGATLGKAITSNCIDCHMPLKPSRAIAVFLPGKDIPTAALIRSHFISIYPDETKRWRWLFEK